MSTYLSPERLPLMNLGVSLDGLSPLTVATILEQAQAVVDSYCNLPTMPHPGTFLGETGVVEEHRWRFPDYEFARQQRRVYPFHWPVRSVTAFSLVASSGASATIDPDSLVINNTERWIEVTSLAIASNSGLIGLAGWIVPIGGLTEPVARVTLDYGWDIAAIDDRGFAIDDTNTVFAFGHEHWIDDSTDPVVQVDGVDASPQPTIDYLLGRVTFGSAQTGRVTATYRHKLPREVPLAEGLIVRSLLGETALAGKDMEGLESIKDAEITITRRKASVGPGGVNKDNLEQTVPGAAQLLAGFRHWRFG